VFKFQRCVSFEKIFSIFANIYFVTLKGIIQIFLGVLCTFKRNLQLKINSDLAQQFPAFKSQRTFFTNVFHHFPALLDNIPLTRTSS